MKFDLPPLPYTYDALEPHIDAETMKVHHDKHHQTYTDKLNEALAKRPDFEVKRAEELLKNLDAVPEDIRAAVHNHGGGYVNHNFFWSVMSSDSTWELESEIAQIIRTTFGSFDSFKEKLTAAALGQFGSGWAWLALNEAGKLEILSTQNQDSPLSKNMVPLLTIDIWEHAYYLKYQNRRADYVAAWWNVVNWKEVNKKYLQIK
jgi:Fe-Mn family superoxide dismutase